MAHHKEPIIIETKNQYNYMSQSGELSTHLQICTCMPLQTDETKTTVFQKRNKKYIFQFSLLPTCVFSAATASTFDCEGLGPKKKRKNATETRIRATPIDNWTLDMEQP